MSEPGDGWVDTGLVFTTRHGTPIEPRNFSRSFDRCITAARVANHRARHSQDLCLATGRPRCPPSRRDAHPAASQIGIPMEVYTEVPSQATRDALRKLGDGWRLTSPLLHFAAAPR